jgi:UDP-glucose 4-epimerase
MTAHESPLAVVGAAGFLGSALVRAALRAGHPCSQFTRRTPLLRPDGTAVPDLARATTVYWLASSINPALAEEEPERIAADRAAFASLLAALAPHPARVVIVSSGGTVYDTTLAPPYDEASPTAPRGAYGRAKLDLERLLREALPGRGVALRVANAYGPGQPARAGQGVLAHWLRAAAAGEAITVIGSRESARDYVHVDDIAEALLAAARPAAPPPVVNVGSGVATTLGDLAELVREVTGSVRAVRYRPARSFDVSRTWLDVSLAQRTLGWRPRVPLPEGVAGTWRSLIAGQALPAHRAG